MAKSGKVTPGKEPLVWVISAKSGTVAEKILRRIELLTTGRDFQCDLRLDEVNGLCLVSEPRSNRFSLRYEEIGDVFYLRIGEDLLERYYDNAAYQIIAMINRGRCWLPRGGREPIAEAYGAPKPCRPYNPLWREEWNEKRRRRMEFSLVC